MAQLVNLGAYTWTTINFNDQTQNLVATNSDAPVTLTYQMAGFDQSFSQHFSESTFGVSIPFVYFGFDVTARAAASLDMTLKVNPGQLGIDYTIDVRDMASAGNVGAATAYGNIAAFTNEFDAKWTTDFRSTGGSLSADSSHTANKASLDFNYLLDFAVNNFKVGIDYYVGEFGYGPKTLIDPDPITGTINIIGDTAGAGGMANGSNVKTEGPFSAEIEAITLPEHYDLSHGAFGDGLLPSMTLTGETANFATAGFDIAKFLGSLLGVELSGEYKIVGNKLVFKYTILSVTLEAGLKVGQTITFTPTGVGVDIVTSVKGMENNRDTGGFAGEHLTGMLGDTFTFNTPDAGSGVLHASVNYTMYGSLSTDVDYEANALVNISALAISLHNTILKDFDIGVGPLIDIDIPEGGVTLGSVDAYNSSVNLQITGTHDEFDFYFERDIQGSPAPDRLDPPNDNQAGILHGYEGDDVYQGNDQNFNLITFRGDGGSDFAFGSANNEALYGDTGDDYLRGNGGDDFIVGGGGDDGLDGGTGDDLIVGMSGRDIINGGAGDDLISGGDILVNSNTPITGIDDINGGEGLDALILNRKSSFVGEVIDMTAADDFHRLSDGTTFRGIERLFLGGGMGNDIIITAGYENEIHGGGGIDLIRSTGGLDEVWGDAGDDIIEFAWGGASTLHGGLGVDRLVINAVSTLGRTINVQEVFTGSGLFADGTKVDGFEEVQFKGGGQADTVTGTAGDDLLQGNGGNDHLISTGGSDLLYGGNGDDLLEVNAGGGADVLDGGFGINTAKIVRIIGGTRLEFGLLDDAVMSDGTQLINIQKIDFTGAGVTDVIRGAEGGDIIHGQSGRDRLDGNRGADQVYGDNGDDLLVARQGELGGYDELGNWQVDNYYGGIGIDSLQLELGGAASGVLLNLSTAGVATGVTGLIHFEGFERYSITGTSFADTITGGDAAGDLDSVPADATGDDAIPFGDRLFGGAGDDTLDGREGRDLVSGGDGNDTILWSEGHDILDGGLGFDTLRIVLAPDRGGSIELRPQAVLADVNGAPDENGEFDPDETGVDDPSAAPDHSDILNARVYGIERLHVIANDQRIDVLGGDYADIIHGSHDNGDILSGRGGDDLIEGDGGFDDLFGGAGDDTLTDSDGDTTADGGEGDDFIEVGWGTSNLTGGAGDDVIRSHIGLTTTYGGDGNDILSKIVAPADRADHPAGESGLYGGDGDDIITSDVQAEMDGGNGEDTIIVNGNDQFLIIDMTDPQLQNVLSNGSEFYDFENLVFNGGSAGENIYVASGVHALNGGGGNDYVDLNLSQTSAAITGGLVNGVLTVGTATITNFEAVHLHLGHGNDTLIVRTTGFYNPYGGGMQVNIDGGDGNDKLGGGTLNEVLDGGAGNDTVVLQGDRSEYEVTVLGDGVLRVSDLVANRDGTDQLLSIEFLQFANGTVSSSVGNIIYGTAADDYISKGAGSPPGQPPVTDLDDWIYTYGGNDVIDGGIGADRMVGGAGNDYYVVNDLGDQVVEFGAEGNDTVASSVSFVSQGSIESIFLTGNNHTDATGTAGSEFIQGNGGGNVIDGRGGADYMYGLGGHDTYYIDDAGDFAVEAANEGYDKVYTTLQTYTLAANIEELEFLNDSGVTGTGNALNNLVIGGADSDTLYGGAGSDSVGGRAGDDILFGGAASSTDGESLAGEDGNDQLHGAAGNDFITGDGDNDVIYLTQGQDYLFGGFGVDTLVVDQAAFSNNDQLRLSEFQFDTGDGQQFLDGFTWEIERLDFRGGSHGEHVRGAEGDDVLKGGLGDDWLYGGIGDDVLEGGKDSDDIYGGAGNDTLYAGGGGGGAVRGDYLYGGDGDDTITAASLFEQDGHSLIDGGAGDDTIIWQGVEGDAFGGSGNDHLTVDRSYLFGDIVMDLRLAKSGTLVTNGSFLGQFETFDFHGGLDGEQVYVGYELNHLDGAPLGISEAAFDKAVIDLANAPGRVTAQWSTAADGSLQLEFDNGMTVTRFDQIGIFVGPGGFGVTNAAPAGAPSLLISDRNPPRLTTNQALVDDTGAYSDDGVSRKSGVEVTGFSNIGDHVVLFDNGVAVKSFDVGLGGKYRFVQTLGEGDHVLTVQASNAWGNADSGPLPTLTIDTTAPVSAAITGFTLDGNEIAPGGSADQMPHFIHGTSSEAFAMVEIFRGDMLYRTTTTDAAGNWSIFLAPPSDPGGGGVIGGGGASEGPQGPQTFTAKVSDLAGNSKTSKAAVVIIDPFTPDAPVFTAITSDTGVSATDNITRDNTLVLRGTAEAGATVTVFKDGSAIGTALVGGTGKWSLDHTAVALADATYHFTATAADKAGNVSEVSTVFDVVVDTTAMAQLNRVGEVGGSLVLNGGYANTHDLLMSGRADAGATVVVSNAAGVIGSTTAGGDGNWTYAYSAAGDGKQVFKAKATDLAGNVASSNAFTVHIDTVAPTAEVRTVTHTSTVTKLVGVAEAGSTIGIYEGGSLLTAVTVNGLGNWSGQFARLSDLSIHTLRIDAQDKAGNLTSFNARVGRSVDDQLNGGASSDALFGGGGADRLNGAGGADWLTGGAGSDVFVFLSGQADGDRVSDFSAGDRLDLYGYGVGAALIHQGGGDWQVVSGGGIVEIIHLNVTTLAAGDYQFL